IGAGDVNGDGKSDLVTADSSATAGEPSTLRVRLGNGDGTFGAPILVSLPAGWDASSLSVADFNGDGRLDVAVSDSLRVLVALGDGRGSFAPEAPYAATTIYPGNAVTQLPTTDLTGDGVPDLVVANGTAGTVTLLPAAPNLSVSGDRDLGAAAIGASTATTVTIR